uniref:Uncharacterized protein n=1 Tax=Aureoumbra lagunensis TaxID=44058 RepID=A0A7S3K3P5_9STRA
MESSQVSALVSAMQQGQLSKADLYASLSGLKEEVKQETPQIIEKTTNVVADLVGAMRQGKLSKSELLSSLSSHIRAEQSVSEESSVTRELRQAEMWAELRSAQKRQEVEDETMPPPPPKEKSQRPKSYYSNHQKKYHQRRAPDLEAEECTFHPKIKELPNGLYRQKTQGSFLERSERWRREREVQLEKKLALEAEQLTSECTFHPRISENSVKAAELSRAGDKRRADDRLYQEHKKRAAAIEKKRLQDLQNEESRFHDEYPFQPTRISKPKSFDQIQPRYIASSPRNYINGESRLQECTFTPRTNQVRQNMDLAKTYLATNVFERLTARRRPNSSDDGDISPRSVASTPNQKATWNAFLARQRAFENKKSQHVNELKLKSTPKFSPHIHSSDGSKNYTTPRRRHSFSSADISSTDFFDRLAIDSRRRDSRHFIKSAKPSRDEIECTFQPCITPKAARRSDSRSFDELSTGDALRRDTSRRLLKLKLEQTNQPTFKPTLSTKRNSPHVESKLRLTSAPESYLERLKREHEKRLEHRRRLQEELDRQQLQEATFEPKTTKCPTYIKRIARGMALAKRAAELTNPNDDGNIHQRPDWR